MNLLEQQLHYPLGDALPDFGTTLEVAPGVKWIRMTLPFALNHINLWLLRDALDGPEGKVQGWTVVDCCITRDEAKAQWEQIFATQLGGLPILRVIVTHMHPDHIGLAHWLCERWNAPLWISATDYHTARIGSQSTIGFGGEGAARFFASHGLPTPSRSRRSAGAPATTPAWCRTCRARFRRTDGRPHGAHRRARLALHQRLRPRARAHRAVLRRTGGADQRRHGVAAHFHQRERSTTWSPRPIR